MNDDEQEFLVDQLRSAGFDVRDDIDLVGVLNIIKRQQEELRGIKGEVKIFAIKYAPKNKRLPVRKYSFTLDSDYEPTIPNIFEVFKFGRKKYRDMHARVFIALFGGKTFIIGPDGRGDHEVFKCE